MKVSKERDPDAQSVERSHPGFESSPDSPEIQKQGGLAKNDRNDSRLPVPTDQPV